MAKEITIEYLNNLTDFGSAKTVGIREGYIDFIQDDPEYIKIIPEDIRKKMETVVSSIKDGSLILPSL